MPNPNAPRCAYCARPTGVLRFAALSNKAENGRFPHSPVRASVKPLCALRTPKPARVAVPA